MGKLQEIRPGTAEDLARRAKIDRFGELDRRLQLSAPFEAEAKVLKAEIESWHKDGVASEPVIERGLLYEIQLSPKRTERTITNKRKVFERLKKALGIDGLIAVLNIPMGAVDSSIPKSEQAGLVAEERSGYRTFTVVPLHSATAPPEKAA